MTGCIGTGFPRFPCALVRMRYSGGVKSGRGRELYKMIYGQVAKWHCTSQSRKIYTGKKKIYTVNSHVFDRHLFDTTSYLTKMLSPIWPVAEPVATSPHPHSCH